MSYIYDTQGRVDKVDQYDNATVGSGSIVDEIQYSYDDWGNVIKFAMDRNSAITSGQLTGSNGYYDFEQAYTKSTSTSGRKTVRLTSMTWPSGDTADYSYLSANGIHDDEVSRVTRIKVGAVTVVQYAYTGIGQVVKIEYPQPNVMWQMHGSTMGSYPDLDNFNRVTSSRWTKDLVNDIDFYDVDLTYDRNSNITLAVDNVLTGFDVDYTNDSLNRLTDAEEGTWGGSSISSRSRQQIWTLDQVGNWNIGKLDLNGDGDFTDADEYDDHRTHDKANELTARDTDNNGTNNYTLTYDALGNLTDDGEYYEYVYDVFGRLRKVKNTTTQALVAEYKYNGLGFRISVHEDTDTDGDVDGSDLWYHYVYDTRWRMVATFRADDNNPKEQFLYQQAGLDGSGGSSYIDAVVLRQKDDNSGWLNAADGVLEQRYYYCQNWRADVSAIVTSGGKMMEWVKYSSYGIPFGLPAGDTDSDGDCDQTDINNIDAVPAYDVRYDLDLDGDVDATDSSRASTTFQGTTLGWTVLSSSSVSNRKGYAGYEYDEAISKYHVRNRILDPALGRWTRRDPLGYVDGMSLYEYVASQATIHLDPMGEKVLWDCMTCFLCAGTAGVTCAGMCCCGQYWDVPGEGFGSCWGKCMKSIQGASFTYDAICYTACLVCLGRTVVTPKTPGTKMIPWEVM